MTEAEGMPAPGASQGCPRDREAHRAVAVEPRVRVRWRGASPRAPQLPHPKQGLGLLPLPRASAAECRETRVERSSDYKEIGLPDGFHGPLCGLVFITP